MDMVIIVLTLVADSIRWIVSVIMAVFIRWWLNWLRGQISKAIIASDFQLSVVTGVEPLSLKLKFKLRNGSARSIRLIKVAVHLNGSGAHIGSVVGVIADNPFISISSPKVEAGNNIDVYVDIIPNLWFWLSSVDSGFTLQSSSIELLTTWGVLRVPLEPERIHTGIKEQKAQIEIFLDRVRTKLSP